MSNLPDDLESLRSQIEKQYRAVAHLAKELSDVHEDMREMLSGPGPHDNLLQMMGERSAHFMEVLGDFLNEMDAVRVGDGWLDPIFEEAQRLWPKERS